MSQFKYESAHFLGARYSDVTRNTEGHSHDYYELNFLTRGKTKMRIREKVFEYESYDFLLVPPHMDHLLYESEYAKFENYVIWFQKDDEPLETKKAIKLHDYDGTVQFLCTQIYQTYLQSGTQNQELIDLYLKAVLWHMKSGMILNTCQYTAVGTELADQAVRYINAHILKEHLTVEKVADVMNVTPEHFTRVFQQKIGTAPIKYMNSMKIAEAKRLLTTEHKTVKEIAEQLHYSDPLYFSKQFSKATGLSPSKYRKSYSEKN